MLPLLFNVPIVILCARTAATVANVLPYHFFSIAVDKLHFYFFFIFLFRNSIFYDVVNIIMVNFKFSFFEYVRKFCAVLFIVVQCIFFGAIYF